MKSILVGFTLSLSVVLFVYSALANAQTPDDLIIFSKEWLI